VANLYKLVFIGEEKEPEFISVGSGKQPENCGPMKWVRFCYQTHLWADTSALAIEEVNSQCEQAEIKVLDFTKISLVVSTESIDRFMKERL
jgi:hypothetical protein